MTTAIIGFNATISGSHSIYDNILFGLVQQELSLIHLMTKQFIHKPPCHIKLWSDVECSL
jgi:hypothetical protein